MKWIDQVPSGAPPLPGLHPIVSDALRRRGITSASLAESFLDPAFYPPTPAVLLPGLEKAIGRLVTAIQSRQKICVWGDFDVDGQTATTILVQALRAVDAWVEYHIPVRATESHGVNLSILKEIIAGGAELIVTCDTGITAHETIQFAQNHGVDVIVTDHHDLPVELPPALALVNPKFLPNDHPLAALSGVGVAYKLAEWLLSEMDSKLPVSDLVDLVALGLISDLAKLVDDTRYLAQLGIRALRENKRPGLAALYEMAELNPGNINESHIGFTIGPRLNALGRLGDANPIVEFFLTQDKQEAAVTASQMENYNAQRRLLTTQVYQAAEAQIRDNPSILEEPILLVKHPSWPSGVLGIAAARLVEKYHKPTILLVNPPGKPAHGSARSVETLHITEAISRVSKFLTNYGGHPMAAGFTLKTENLPAFQRNLMKAAREMMPSGEEIESTLPVDAWVSIPEISSDLASDLGALSPYGPGNPQLILASKALRLESAVPLGRNSEHRKLKVGDQGGNPLEVLWWNGGEQDPPQGTFDLAYTVRQSDWHGTQQIQVEFIDFRREEENPVDIISGAPEVIDFRGEKELDQLLERIKNLTSTALWAEGEEKRKIRGIDRTDFAQADVLVIWTVPPSPEELTLAKEKVNPKIIWLVGCHQPEDTFEGFIPTLTGMIKYVLKHENGRVSYEKLAAATAQRLSTVKYGVSWLVAKGMIETEPGKDGEVTIKVGNSKSNSRLASQTQANMEFLLAETAAYRSYFRLAGKDTFFS